MVSEFTFLPAGGYTQIGVDFNPGDNAQVYAQIGYFGVNAPTFLRTDDWSLAERR